MVLSLLFTGHFAQVDLIPDFVDELVLMRALQALLQPVLNLVAELLHVAVELTPRFCRDGLKDSDLILALTKKYFVEKLFLLWGPVLSFALAVLRYNLLDSLVAGQRLTDRGLHWLRVEVTGKLLVEGNVLLEIWGFIFYGLWPFQLQKVHIYQVAPISQK